MLGHLVRRLEAAGCVAAEEEAAEILAASGGDAAAAEAMAVRREAGEPLAWITGRVVFGNLVLGIVPGVYVPRPQTEILLAAAVATLPAGGSAVDLCTGCGAVAAALAAARPSARIVATESDPLAWRCATANGVDTRLGDLHLPLPAGWHRATDVVTAVAPYVPTGELPFLPRDSRDHEPLGALDGGGDGLLVLRRVVRSASLLLRPGGHLVVEVGGDQNRLLEPLLAAAGFGPAERFTDEDGDLRALRARLEKRPAG
jgi:release factor glutamine methyltransferase